MLVDESDAERLAFAQVVRCGRAEAAGSNDDDIRLADHYAVSPEVGRSIEGYHEAKHWAKPHDQRKPERCLFLARSCRRGSATSRQLMRVEQMSRTSRDGRV